LSQCVTPIVCAPACQADAVVFIYPIFYDPIHQGKCGSEFLIDPASHAVSEKSACIKVLLAARLGSVSFSFPFLLLQPTGSRVLCMDKIWWFGQKLLLLVHFVTGKASCVQI